MNQTNTTPQVSVLITVRNAEAYISETLASILQERNVPLEIVLVDNGCTDSTIEKALAFNDERVRVVPGPKKGISHALNVAYAAARGEIFMRCDGDDLFPPDRISRQVEWLNQHPEFGVVCGAFSTIDEKGAFLANLALHENAEEITEELQNSKTRTHIGTFAMRAEVVKAAGYSREFFDCFEDVDFQLRLGEACRVCYVPEIMYQYRLLPTSVTHSKSQKLMEFYDAQAFEFQRQRKTRGMDDLQLGNPPAIPTFDDKVYTVSEHTARMLTSRAWSEHQAGHKIQALSAGLRLVISQPANLTAWRSLVFLLIKPAGRASVSSS